MTAQKRKLLEATYHEFIQITLYNKSLDNLTQLFDDDFMGYGTTIDEKVNSAKDYIPFITRQREQAQGIEMEIERTPIFKKIAPDGNGATIVEEFLLTLLIGNEKHEIFMRLSTILEYQKEKWKIVHLHASKPGNTDGAEDTWHINEWQRKNAELTQLVAEKTAELSQKNKELILGTALERIRNRTLLMKDSSELHEVVSIVFQEFKTLGLLPDQARTYFSHINTDKLYTNAWMTNADGSMKSQSHQVPLNSSPLLKKYYQFWKRQDPILVRQYKGKALKNYLQFVASLPHTKTDEGYQQLFRSPPKQLFMTDAFFQQGSIGIMTFEPLSQETLDIQVRFAQLFEFTFTRFLDLQKAERQAREAQIETALEKVRSRSLAMRTTEEMEDVVGVVLEKLKELKIENDGEATIFTYEKGARDSICWLASDMNFSIVRFSLPSRDAEFDSKIWESRDNGIKYITDVIRAEELKDYFGYLFEHTDFKYIPDERKEWILNQDCYSRSIAFSDSSAILIPSYTGKVLNEEQGKVLVRFSNVFNQAYTRFLDLQKAEANAREAQIEAALERVRASAMAMHHSSELKEVGKILFEQLQNSGLAPISSWITLMNPATDTLEIWAKHGKQVAEPQKVKADDHPNFRAEIEAWKDKVEFIKIANPKEDFIQAVKAIFDFDVKDRPDKTNFHLMEIRNRYGYLGLGTWEEASEKDIEIYSRFSKVFEQTYTRFLDLKTSEEQAELIKLERDRLEKTLQNLQATQKQLIQAEKMASLGELTAGIAHEIQNPLNFVNNFSEVSNELMEELQEELTEGNMEDVQDLIGMLTQNLEKINHHGNRASGIVKGMLAHSRSSSATEKELTDLNSLCDEYLRLAYHGLRAKDRSFNASYELNLAEDLPKLEIVRQDIGRVILNLINNAFYIVNEKAKEGIADYEPKVVISTKAISPSGGSRREEIHISVKDNGKGIPKDIIDKIFQPFFTTKPTGQGTGLGLSLSYDIIKAHGGVIRVDSKEGSGTVFHIVLQK